MREFEGGYRIGGGSFFFFNHELSLLDDLISLIDRYTPREGTMDN